MGQADGRRAVVTGAASGIGYAVVERLLADGASVVAVDINEAGMRPLADAGAELVVASVADPAGRDRIAETAGEIDFLVNSAGVLFVKRVWDITPEEWRGLYGVNAEGTFFMMQRLGRQIRDGGAIMNLSSTSARLANTHEVTPYSSSKAAVANMTRSWAYVMAERGIRVNAMMPGIVDTPMQDRVLEAVAPLRGTTFEALSAGRNTVVPLGRAGTPAECAGVLVFYLYDETTYITGQMIDFSGGYVMW